MAEQPQPLPQGSVPQSDPATPPATTPVQEAIPPISGDQQIQFTDRNGQPVVQTAAQLAEAFRNRVSDEDRADLTLYQKAFKEGDPEATRQIYEKYMPSAPASASTPKDIQEQLSATNKRLEELTTAVGKIQPTVTDINAQREVVVFGQALKQSEKEYPYSATHPKGAALVQQRYNGLLAEAKQMGHDPGTFTPQIRQQIAARAVQDIEAHLKETAEAFQGRVPGAAQPSGPNITSVNDQGQNNDPTHREAPIQLGSQGYFDSRLPSGAPVPGETLPNTPVSIPTGAAPGVMDGQVVSGPMTQSQLAERMKARINAASGLGQ